MRRLFLSSAGAAEAFVSELSLGERSVGAARWTAMKSAHVPTADRVRKLYARAPAR